MRVSRTDMQFLNIAFMVGTGMLFAAGIELAPSFLTQRASWSLLGLFSETLPFSSVSIVRLCLLPAVRMMVASITTALAFWIFKPLSISLQLIKYKLIKSNSSAKKWFCASQLKQRYGILESGDIKFVKTAEEINVNSGDKAVSLAEQHGFAYRQQ